MATGQIRMSPETMTERAGQYMTEHDNLGEIVSKLDSLLEELESEWEGDASAAYAEKYREELKPAFIEAQNLLGQIADALKTIAEAYKENEETIAGSIRV